MSRKEMLDLMQFVCDQNKVALFEVVQQRNIELDANSLEAILNVLEATTKNKKKPPFWVAFLFVPYLSRNFSNGFADLSF